MSRRVFVGNLPQDIRERELEDLFYKYGRILEIDLKLPPRPPGFAFVEFDDPRDAVAAVQGRDGYDFYGSRLRVRLITALVTSRRIAARLLSTYRLVSLNHPLLFQLFIG